MRRSFTYWRTRSVKWLIVLTLLPCIYFLYNRQSSAPFDEKQFWKNVQQRNFPTKHFKFLAKYCDKDCLYVMDNLIENVGHYQVSRMVTFSDNNVDSFVCTHLLKPDFNEEDTSKWAEDHSQLAAKSINNAQIIQIFASGQLPLSTDMEKNVLIFGAGTGTAFMHLQHHFKKMTITGLEIDKTIVRISREWFDFKPDPPNRFLLQNVEDHVKQTTKEGHLYDIVLADVCHQQISNHDWTCPPPSLIKDEFISNLRKAMKPNGILSVNLLHLESYQKYSQLAEKFARFFDSCELIRLPYASNTLLTCYTSKKRMGDENVMPFLMEIGIEI